MKKIIIAIDGFSSCGKSTIAKELARKLQYIFIDSGAMYRAIALYFIEKDIELSNTNEVENALKSIQLAFKTEKDSNIQKIYLNENDVTSRIREMDIANMVSLVARNKAVREFATTQQRAMGATKGIVMDGRDIGTTVFPNAELKIFVTASIDVRVKRRLLELSANNNNITYEEVKQNLEFRDYTDQNREISPLRKAADAKLLDNTNLTPDQQMSIVINWVEAITNG
jgi:cytidylate kinase